MTIYLLTLRATYVVGLEAASVRKQLNLALGVKQRK